MFTHHAHLPAICAALSRMQNGQVKLARLSLIQPYISAFMHAHDSKLECMYAISWLYSEAGYRTRMISYYSRDPLMIWMMTSTNSHDSDIITKLKATTVADQGQLRILTKFGFPFLTNVNIGFGSWLALPSDRFHFGVPQTIMIAIMTFLNNLAHDEETAKKKQVKKSLTF